MMKLTDEQLKAVRDAAALLLEGEVSYVLMAFNEDGVGSIFSSIPPVCTVEALEGALSLARARMPGEPVGRLQ